MGSSLRSVQVVVVAGILVAATVGQAETRKEYRFKVGRRPSVSISNQFGPVTVKAGTAKWVVVVALLNSDRVEVDQAARSRFDNRTGGIPSSRAAQCQCQPALNHRVHPR